MTTQIAQYTSFASQQPLWAAILHDFALLKNNDTIKTSDTLEPVRDRQNCAIVEKGVHQILHLSMSLIVKPKVMFSQLVSFFSPVFRF